VNKLLNVAGVELGFDAYIPAKSFSSLSTNPAFGEVKSYIDFDRTFYSFDMRASLKKFDFVSCQVIS